MDKTLIKAIQCRVAVSAIEASGVRGRGLSKTAGSLRDYLTAIKLDKFSLSSERLFKRHLDSKTEDLLQKLPQSIHTWGIARNALNLFLHDAFYNFYLREEFGLASSEPWYEVPLDASLARRLKKHDAGQTLPRWPGIKQLTPSVSENYQLFALLLAREKGVSRVHLGAALLVE